MLNEEDGFHTVAGPGKASKGYHSVAAGSSGSAGHYSSSFDPGSEHSKAQARLRWAVDPTS